MTDFKFVASIGFGFRRIRIKSSNWKHFFAQYGADSAMPSGILDDGSLRWRMPAGIVVTVKDAGGCVGDVCEYFVRIDGYIKQRDQAWSQLRQLSEYLDS